MSDELKRVVELALKLPGDARAALAGRLLDSLDQEVDENAEAAWSAEISKRLARLDSGVVKAVSWAEARRAILLKDDEHPNR
ncbi:MAG: addiction module protein [Myxococcaceae bacterium]|nr:addiction module protein [Myxococcaceae bacterium]